MKGCDDPCRYRPSDSWEQVGLPHAEAMVGGARPKLKRGRPKEVKRGSVKEKSNELWEEEEGRKLDLCEGDSLDCRVLLTRLETSGDKDKESCLETPIEPKVEGSNSLVRGRTKPCKSRQKTCKAYRLALEPNNQSKVLCTLPVVEPRKRRLASLNAEAVNSLLLYREHPQGSRLANKLQSNGNLAKNAIILGHNTPSGPKVAKSDICGTGSSKKTPKGYEDGGRGSAESVRSHPSASGQPQCRCFAQDHQHLLQSQTPGGQDQLQPAEWGSEDQAKETASS